MAKLSEYEDTQRGDIRIPRFARRARTFAGLRFGNITPTDIDCSFDVHGKTFFFVEGKSIGCEMQDGQRRHLEYLVNGLRDSGKKAFAIVIAYPDGEDEVDYAECAVDSWFPGDWWRPPSRQVNLRDFIEFVLQKCCSGFR